jgi:hypothetical protein
MLHHIELRKSEINYFFELQLIRWCCKNYYASTRIKKLFITSRTMQKVFYGVKTLFELTNPIFTQKYLYEFEGVY